MCSAIASGDIVCGREFPLKLSGLFLTIAATCSVLLPYSSQSRRMFLGCIPFISFHSDVKMCLIDFLLSYNGYMLTHNVLSTSHAIEMYTHTVKNLSEKIYPVPKNGMGHTMRRIKLIINVIFLDFPRTFSRCSAWSWYGS